MTWGKTTTIGGAKVEKAERLDKPMDAADLTRLIVELARHPNTEP
jgi:hypothetical protein